MTETPHLPMGIAKLPGAELVEQGLVDLSRGLEDTVPALLVLIGAPKLRRAGLDVPARTFEGFPEDRLYLLLARQHDDAAHGVYNAVLARLVAFEHAAEQVTCP